MIPSDAIRTVNKGYSDALNNNHSSSIVVTFNMDENLIWGQNQTPSFLFSGRKHKFVQHEPDTTQEYVDKYYPHCSRCLHPGTTRQVVQNRIEIKIKPDFSKNYKNY